jgi:hypothetical protein
MPRLPQPDDELLRAAHAADLDLVLNEIQTLEHGMTAALKRYTSQLTQLHQEADRLRKAAGLDDPEVRGPEPGNDRRLHLVRDERLAELDAEEQLW